MSTARSADPVIGVDSVASGGMGAAPVAARVRDALLAAAAALGVGVAVLLVVLLVGQRGVVVPAGAAYPGWPETVVGLTLFLPGLLLVRHRGSGPLRLGAVLAISGAGWLADGLASEWLIESVWRRPGLPGAALAHTVVDRYGGFLLLGLPLVLLLFPDGRLPRARWGRAVAYASLASTALLPLTLLLAPAGVVYAHLGETPVPEIAALDAAAPTLDLPFWPVVLDVAYVALPCSIVVPFVLVVVRYRRARGVRRAQMRWLLWAGLVDLVVMAVARVLPALGSEVGLALAVAVTVTAVVLAVTRHRLADVDRLLPATLVTVALAAGVVAVDLAVLAAAGAVLPDRDSALIAVAVVAVAYTPLRTRLWTLARRLARGRRDDPYGAVATLAGRLESATEPGQQLAALARTVAEAFRLPYVRVEIDRADGARAIVEHGAPTDDVVTLPVSYRDEPIGRVALATGGATPLSQRDQRLLGDLLRQAASAARAGALGASLQRARAALVTAREEERRRLRRDLHDSLGPGLAAITLRVETARELAGTDAAGADRTLEKVTGAVSTLLADVRRLVHDLRPPALDDIGLAAALREAARGLSGPETAFLVEAGELGALPAAVEVAAYRIATEAMNNVVRHAGAGRAVVALERLPGGLSVRVTDDGRGIGTDVVAGVGTLSLRERAAELGGQATITCPDGGGTLVAAHLPIEEPSP